MKHHPISLRENHRAVWICLSLVFLTLFAFWPVGKLGLIDLDDYRYLVDNPHVRSGLTFANLKWAFTTAYASNWHPLTWISLLLDHQWFGLHPAGYHWMNLAWHVANVVLLFLVLRQMSGRMWLAAGAVMLFAVHPLRVESVAWVSERKDVLSGFFFLLTLWAWIKYAQVHAGGNAPVDSVPFWKSGFYWLALGAFALGLMSKPMVVSEPIILLLLDGWPLGRFSRSNARAGKKGLMSSIVLRPLLVEKLPFAALALGSCVLTLWAQSRSGAVVSTERLPLDWRLLNVPLCYAAYLKLMFWPFHLAIFYPYSHTRATLMQFLGATVMLGGFTGICIHQRHRRPWLLMGWAWFVIMLVPVIGLVQVGVQSIADRYTYLPSIGIAIMLTWLVANFAGRSPVLRRLTMAGALVLALALTAGVRRQLGYWKNSVTLFNHALAVNGENNTIRLYLANACWADGDLAGAATNYQDMLERMPQSVDIHYRLGYVRMQQKKDQDAMRQSEDVLRLAPKNINAHMCLASLLSAQQKIGPAEQHLMAAMLLRPGDPGIKAQLAHALQQIGAARVVSNLSRQLKTEPTAGAHARLAMIWLTQNKYGAAEKELEAALALNPRAPEVLNQLAWLRSTCPDASLRNGPRAIGLARRACELTGNRQARTFVTLSAALARSGRFAAGLKQVQKALVLASASGENDLVSRAETLQEDYRNHQAFESLP